MPKNANDKSDDSKHQGKSSVNQESIKNSFEIEIKLIFDEFNPKVKPKLWISSFSLCDEKLPGIEIHVWAKMDPYCFDVTSTSYVECDDSFGGEFTMERHYQFDTINTKKFYQSLDNNFDRIVVLEIIKQKFSGTTGLAALEAYCQEKLIDYQYTTHSQE